MIRASECEVKRPVALAVRPEGIPAELKARGQWVCWRYEWREGKKGNPGQWTKVPVNERGKAKSNDPSTWATFAEALSYHQANPDTTAGVGFVFSEDDP